MFRGPRKEYLIFLVSDKEFSLERMLVQAFLNELRIQCPRSA
jgi:hypothetical protein